MSDRNGGHDQQQEERASNDELPLPLLLLDIWSLNIHA
jgi:hypothetical protein